MTGRDLTHWREREGMTIVQAALRFCVGLTHWARWESLPDRLIPRRIVKAIETIEAIHRPPTGPGLTNHSTPKKR